MGVGHVISIFCQTKRLYDASMQFNCRATKSGPPPGLAFGSRHMPSRCLANKDCLDCTSSICRQCFMFKPVQNSIFPAFQSLSAPPALMMAWAASEEMIGSQFPRSYALQMEHKLAPDFRADAHSSKY